MLKHPFRSLLLAIMLLPLAAHALTLGEARVKSFLNQPLDVEIDLVGLAPGQHQDLRLRIANQAHFDRLGIVYEHFLSDLQFDIVGSGTDWIVRARSSRPISEPFVDFPLQMTWPGGQLVKQYTLLLDPPRRISKATVSAARATRTAPATTPATAAPTPLSDESYGPVQRGETLWPIAQRLRPAGTTTRQMAMALLRANPEAFIDGNINKLRAGAVLKVPPLAFIEELDAAQARQAFAEAARRRQPAVTTSPRKLPPAGDAGAITSDGALPPAAEPAVESVEQPATDEPDPTLRIVTEKRDEPVGDDEQSLKERLLVTMEEIESNRITTDAIESRLGRLEQELSRMQQLVELKDAQIAALRAEISAREAIEKAARVAEPEPPAPLTLPGDTTPPAASVTAPTPAPMEPVARVEGAPVTTVDPQQLQPWYQPYLWMVWVVLGLLGLTAVLMMFRRQADDGEATAMPELPKADRRAARDYADARPEPSKTEMREARNDLREASRDPTPAAAPAAMAPAAELPEVSEAQIAEVEQRVEGLTNSLLDEMLEDGKHLQQPPSRGEDEVILDTDIGDTDLDSWVDEIVADEEQLRSAGANETEVALDEDIPSLLTELDDQIGGSNATVRNDPAPIQLEPLDEITEDDAFSMSLDLARAYLEIGDQDGARDMLKQALSGARDPEHRRQIQELLTQIG